jgi:hypothetical protein
MDSVTGQIQQLNTQSQIWQFPQLTQDVIMILNQGIRQGRKGEKNRGGEFKYDIFDPL